jgi:uracil-DNA glycosylase family 4
LGDPKKELEELHQKIRACVACPLHRTRTQAVPGVGNARARVMLIGEGPGRMEDLKGEPFVGQAGQFLDRLLASVGLTRQEVYITNVVKCRPVRGAPPYENRPPNAEEIAACAPWLDQQLALIQPKLIVTLGRYAMEAFLPGKKISEVHGKLFSRGDQIVLPLYHPAVALYRADQKETLIEDFQIIREVLAEISSGARG